LCRHRGHDDVEKGSSPYFRHGDLIACIALPCACVRECVCMCDPSKMAFRLNRHADHVSIFSIDVLIIILDTIVADEAPLHMCRNSSAATHLRTLGDALFKIKKGMLFLSYFPTINKTSGVWSISGAVVYVCLMFENCFAPSLCLYSYCKEPEQARSFSIQSSCCAYRTHSVGHRSLKYFDARAYR